MTLTIFTSRGSMKPILFAALAMALSGLAACSQSSESKKEVLSYEFEVNSCKTGRHEFSSQQDLCQGLQNETLNKGCALAMRESYFAAQCSGQRFQPFHGNLPAEKTTSTETETARSTETQSEVQSADSAESAGSAAGGLEMTRGQEDSVIVPGDKNERDTLFRTLTSGQASLVLFENMSGLPERTMVFCLPEGIEAREFLAQPRMGGVMLKSGGKMLFKNDQSARFKDGSQHSTKFIQIECV